MWETLTAGWCGLSRPSRPITDKVTDDCEKNMEYALQRVDERTAVVSDDDSK